MDKKVLIITYDMIPHSSTWGGCQRMYFLSEFLVDHGFNVTVFSAQKGTNDYFGNDISFNNVTLKATNKIANAILMSNGEFELQHKKENSKELKLLEILNRFRSYVKNNQHLFKIINCLDQAFFNEPGSLTGYLSRSWIKSIRKQIKEYSVNNGINNIVISGPPFGMFSMGKYLKKSLKNVNIIYDYRDPWNLWKDNNKLSQFIEKNYLSYADAIVCTNHNLVNAMSSKFSIDESKFSVVQNGYSEKTWANIPLTSQEENEIMVITYVGVIDLFYSLKIGYRNFSTLLEAIESCLRDGKKIRLKLVGVVNENTEYALHLKNKYQDNIQFVGVLKNKDSYVEMLKSDVLLLLHTTSDKSSKYIVSGKMYDYIRAGKPILSIGSIGGLHDVIIKKENLGVSCEDNVSEIYQALVSLYNAWESKDFENKNNNIFNYSREYQYHKYIELLENK